MALYWLKDAKNKNTIIYVKLTTVVTNILFYKIDWMYMT